MEIYLGVTTETLKQAKSTSNSSSVIQQKKLLSPSKLEIHNESSRSSPFHTWHSTTQRWKLCWFQPSYGISTSSCIDWTVRCPSTSQVVQNNLPNPKALVRSEDHLDLSPSIQTWIHSSVVKTKIEETSKPKVFKEKSEHVEKKGWRTFMLFNKSWEKLQEPSQWKNPGSWILFKPEGRNEATHAASCSWWFSPTPEECLSNWIAFQSSPSFISHVYTSTSVEKNTKTRL